MSAICSGFVPHSVKVTRCKRCFRELNEHKESADVRPKSKTKVKDTKKADSGDDGSEDVTRSTRRRRCQDGDAKDEEQVIRRSRERKSSFDNETTERRRRSANLDQSDGGVRAAKEVERSSSPQVPPETSNESTSADVEFILQVKTSTDQQRALDDAESIAATETTETTLTFQDTVEELQTAIQTLKKQLESSEEKVLKLEMEKETMLKSRIRAERDATEKTASEILKLKSEMNKMSTMNDELKDENKEVKAEVEELQEEVEKRKTPEVVNTIINQLKTKLQQTENLVEELMEENKEVKLEIAEMEEEMDEMQDNFKEEQADEYRDLRKELENSSKNCRVLQFKLRKAEKRADDLVSDKSKLADKIKDLSSVGKLDVDKVRFKEVAEELVVAKEISRHLTNELESIKKLNKQLESENESLKSSKTTGKDVGIKAKSLQKNSSSLTDSNQLMRDLYDAVERENDLKEQLKFAEEASKSTRKKTSSLEQENESLLLQVRKMAHSRQGKHPRVEADDDSDSKENLQLQLELNEQEMSVLRRKLEDGETENEEANKELEFLREKLASQPVTEIDVPEPPEADQSDECKYHQHKIRVLQSEAKELRRKLIDRERDNERMKTEVEVLRKRGTKVMVRSRSLDGDLQVDLKRQLQLVEQEAGILRQKAIKLESENDKLNSENRRLSLRLSRKPAPTPAEKLGLENLELKDQLEELRQKMSTLSESIRSNNSEEMVAVVRRPSLTESEQELISSLKKRIRQKEDESADYRTRCAKLDIDVNRLERELKKLKDQMTTVKRRDRKKVRDDATRMDLKEIIQELEEEISDLYMALRGRETLNESLQESLEREKREQDKVKKEFKSRLEDREAKTNKEAKEKQLLEQKLKNRSEELKVAQQKLEEESNRTKETNAFQTSDSTDFQGRIDDLQNRLQEKTKSSTEFRESIEKATKERNEVSKTVERLEEENKLLNEQVCKQKESSKSSDGNFEKLKKQLDEMESGKKKADEVVSELRHELEKNKTKLKKVDNRQTEVAVGWLKEREELKQSLQESTEKAESLRKELFNAKEKLRSKDEEFATKLKENVESKRIEDVTTSLKDRIEELKETNERMKQKCQQQELQIEKACKESKDLQDRNKRLLVQQKKEKDEWERTEADKEAEVKSLQRKYDKQERDRRHEMTGKEEDLLQTKDKLVKVERDLRRLKARLEETEKDNQDKLKASNRELTKEKQEYEDLTAKYDLLEEDYVVVKAKLVMEKEKIEEEHRRLKSEHVTLKSELKTVRETFNSRQDTWIKEKLDKEERLKELEAKMSRSEGWEAERLQLQDTLKQNSSLVESYRKEEKHLKEERERLRRQVDDQARIMAEYQKVATRSTSAKGETEGEKLTALRKEKEQMISLMGEEIQTMQKQILAFQKERDSYKDQLQAAEVKMNNEIRKRERNVGPNATDNQKVTELQTKIEDLEDKLAGQKLEYSNLQTEYLSDRTRWNIQNAELKSKMNQLEEKNVIEGLGRSSRMLAKTKLELAWDKERAEQQRLLTDSKKLIAELGDKLITVESLRDKEKSDAKRQLQDLKRTMENEQGDTKSKIREMHRDLQDLREAHARVRTTNEMLKKDKEMQEKEKEDLRIHIVQLENHHDFLTDLIGEVEKLSTIAPEVLAKDEPDPSKDRLTPYRGRPPLVKAASEDSRSTKEEFQETLNNIMKKTEELKKDRQQKPYRRTVSAIDRPPLPGIKSLFEKDNIYGSWNTSGRWAKQGLPTPPPSMYVTMPRRNSTLQRKSMSLQDQQLDKANSEEKIWLSTDTSEQGSSESLQYPDNLNRLPKRPERRRRTPDSSRETSIEPISERRSRKTMKERLKKLVSTKSVEESDTGQRVADAGRMTANVGLGTEAPEERRRRDSSLSSKLRNVFRKPSSRTNSIDREADGSKEVGAGSSANRSQRGRWLEQQSSTESMSSTSGTLDKNKKDKKSSLLNRFASGKRTRSFDIPSSSAKGDK